MNILKTIYASVMMIPVIIWLIIGICFWYILTWKVNRDDKNYWDDSCAD